MGKLVRRSAVVAGLVFLLFLTLPEPAQACYACQLVPLCVDFTFGGYWCGYVLACRYQGFPCSICYDGCIEGFDTCSNIGPPCQFASTAPRPNPVRLASGATFAPPVAR